MMRWVTPKGVFNIFQAEMLYQYYCFTYAHLDVEATKREKFKMLINHHMERGDMLVILKLDRLDRDNIDVQNTIILVRPIRKLSTLNISKIQ